MICNPLHRPRIYAFTQRLWYRSGQQRRYVEEWIRPQPEDCILDIGCGPARLLDLLPPVRYVGYDPNTRYIVDAARRYAARGEFHSGHLTDICVSEAGRFDIVLANAVLHHVSDEAAHELLALASKGLKPRGRMITRDGCYEAGQSALVRLLLRFDRGHFVRTQTEYESLLRPHFEVVRSATLRDALRLPYSLIHFELRKK
jgi:SAM-dependent methyltransferase